MTSVLSLSADQVSSVVSMTELIKVVERGLGNFSKGPEGGVVQPVRSVVMVNKPDGGEQDGYFFNGNVNLSKIKTVCVHALPHFSKEGGSYCLHFYFFILFY